MISDDIHIYESPIIFKSIDIMWIFTWDLLIPISFEVDLVSEKIFNSNFCKAFLRKKSSNSGYEMRTKNGNNVDIKELLELFSSVESDILDFDYLEEENFSRYLLEGFRIKIPWSNKFYDSKVLLTISNLGIPHLAPLSLKASFTFWIPIEEELSSTRIADLESLPMYG